MSAYVQYTVLRLALLLVPFLLLLLVGVETVWALVGAALFSLVTSWVVLRGPREAMARDLEAKVARRRADREARLAAQRTDEEEDEAESGRPPS